MADVRVPKLPGGTGNGNGKKRQPGGRKHNKPESAPANASKYHRGARLKVKGISDKKLRSRLQENEAAAAQAAIAAARAEILLPESSGFMEAEDAREKTYKVTQSQISSGVDANTAAKAMDLRMPDFAPYRLNYTRNGRYMVLGGSKGDLSVVDCLRNESLGQVHVNETVRDVTFLHNETMFAAAQRKHIFIYDQNGMEIHRLRSHVQPARIQFLPYHFLLSSVGQGGWLKYQDTSTGQLVAEHRTKLGACDTMALNPWNAVTLLG
jgi:U3 small nucleolar RNA-associated protein 7